MFNCGFGVRHNLIRFVALFNKDIVPLTSSSSVNDIITYICKTMSLPKIIQPNCNNERTMLMEQSWSRNFFVFMKS